jgi:tRNA pseudouridine55 synthase
VSERRQRERPRLDGILVVAKPPGPTSHDVVAIVRRLTGVRRVGHGGTLDPFATGVLPVFLGHATRLVEYHLADEKSYRATIVLGARSTTDDLDGDLTPTDGPVPGREALEAALAAFRGPIVQVPPDHSAVHVGGRRAYELARRGEKPELRPREVTVHALDLEAWDATDPNRPAAVLAVRCSAGTYVRSLARDLGEALGCGAYLGALTRTASGPFRLEDAHPLEAVREALAAGRASDLLVPPDAGLDGMVRVALPPDEVAALARGQVVRHRGGSLPPRGEGPHADLLRVVDEAGRLLAVARRGEGGRIRPDKVFVEPGR